MAVTVIQLVPLNQFVAAFALLPGAILKGSNIPSQQSILCPFQGSGKLQPKTTLLLESFNREYRLAHRSSQIVELVRRQLWGRF